MDNTSFIPAPDGLEMNAMSIEGIPTIDEAPPLRGYWRDWPWSKTLGSAGIFETVDPQKKNKNKSTKAQKSPLSQLKKEANKDRATKDDLLQVAELQGNEIARAAVDAMGANTDLSYEDTINGFLSPGESTTGVMLEYDSAEIWECGDRAESSKLLARGQAVFTDKRLLLVSCKPTALATVTMEGVPQNGHSFGSWQLAYKAANSVSYMPIPLTSFRGVSVSLEISSTGEATVQKKTPDISQREGPCPCCPIKDNEWIGSNDVVKSSERYIELDYEGVW